MKKKCATSTLRYRLAAIIVWGLVEWFSSQPGFSQNRVQPEYFGVQVIDAETHRGVPLVELRSVNGVSHWTDSAGWIAMDEPAWEGQDVYFFVAGHGYEVGPDGFDFRGVKLNVQSGSTVTISINRLNLAERLYRITGSDIYRDSLLLKKATPIREPLLNARVMGSDSVQSAEYRGKIFWFWGDTNRPEYPLGNFHVPGATSPSLSNGLDPNLGIDLNYFRDAGGFAKETCRMEGPGPTWIQGLTVLGSGSQERMFAGYMKVKSLTEIYERGIVEWNSELNAFDLRVRLAGDTPLYPMGHSVIDRSGTWVYFCDPLPWVRVGADSESFLDPQQYEAWSYFQTGSTASDFRLDRDPQGSLIWQWRKNTIKPTLELEERLLKDQLISKKERSVQLTAHDSGRLVKLHTASIGWSTFRQRWVLIGLEIGGESSHLGEVYYSDSAELTGPWSPAVKIVTHDQYSFYNVRWHPFLSDAEGRHLYFEGTYTQTFSNAPHPTPRYDYNQIMYRLDLNRLPD